MGSLSLITSQWGNYMLWAKNRHLLTDKINHFNVLKFLGKFPTTDNMALVILLSVPHIQQQIWAVRVGAICEAGGRHWRVLDALLSILVQIHFSHATDNTINEPGDSQLHRVKTVRGSHCYRLYLMVFPPQGLWGQSLIALTAPKQAQ